MNDRSMDEFREVEPRMVFCPVCDGDGEDTIDDGSDEIVDCWRCYGTGEVVYKNETGDEFRKVKP